MGCNCNKNSTPLSLRQRLRRQTKEKFAEVRKIWQESADGKIISTKNELGFKPKE